jgi:putative selenium metabolism hydrolase
MVSLGYDSVDVDCYGNVTGRISFPRPGKTLLLEAQMDQVEVSDPSEWTYYPFGAVIENGRIYGRGASDQKGCLAAMILAAVSLREDHMEDMAGELVVSATVQQERFEGVSSQLIARKYRPDGVVIGEASGLKLERGQRGRAEIVVDTLGRMAHSSNPGYGVNAAMHMVSLLSVIKQCFLPRNHGILGDGILELTNLVSFPERNTGAIPDKCRAVFDRRLLPDETRQGVISQIEDIIAIASRENPGMKASVSLARFEDSCYTGVPVKGEHFAPAWLLPEDHDFIRMSLKGMANAGLEPVLSDRAGFGTNGSYYGGEACIPTVAFGPSVEALVHIIDEYIEIDQLLKGFRGYCGIAGEVLSAGEAG